MLKCEHFELIYFDVRIVVDKVNIKDVVDKLLKRFECEGEEAIRDIAGKVNSLREEFKSLNRQTLQEYRDAYTLFLQITNILPWNTSDMNSLMKGGLSYAYSRSNTNIIGQEYTTAIDALAALYNCMVMQHQIAYDHSDLLEKVRALIQAEFYAEEAITYYKNNKSLLTNVSVLFGESFFLALKYLIEGERYEMEAVLRSQRNDVVADPSSFEQFVGLMTSAMECYKSADKLAMGFDGGIINEYIEKRIRSATGAMLYASGGHFATENPAQAVKDLLTALENEGEHVDSGTVNQLLMQLWEVKGIQPAPQCSIFQPTVIDIHDQYEKYNLAFPQPENDVYMIPAKAADLMKRVEARITEKLASGCLSAKLSEEVSLLKGRILEIENRLEGNKELLLIANCEKINREPNLRERLKKGTEFEQVIRQLVDQCDPIQQMLTQIVVADADNVRKYGQNRWDSSRAMAEVNSYSQELQEIKTTLEQQKGCIDYLRQYDDGQYSELFAFCEKAGPVSPSDDIRQMVVDKVQSIESEISELSTDQGSVPAVKLIDIYNILSEYSMNQNEIDEGADYAIQELVRRGIIANKDRDMSKEITELNECWDAYIKQFTVTEEDLARFEGQVEMINNLTVTLESGEKFTDSIRQKLEVMKDAAKRMMANYRRSVENEWDAFSKNNRVLVVSVSDE